MTLSTIPMSISQVHLINETHLGTDATPEQARSHAGFLTAAGYPSEYTSTQGTRPLCDPETGEEIEIPMSVWMECLNNI